MTSLHTSGTSYSPRYFPELIEPIPARLRSGFEGPWRGATGR